MDIDISSFLGDSIKSVVRDSIKLSAGNVKELLYLKKYIAKCGEAVKIRSGCAASGDDIPPFLIASIIKTCNLHCRGCYAEVNNACAPEQEQMDENRWAELFREAEELGVSMIMLAGGEPFLREDVLLKAAERKSILFPVFTNGTMIGEKWLRILDKNRNLVPILSLEGGKQKTDERRGPGVYESVEKAMGMLKKRDILYGASVTVTRENIEEVTGEPFIGMLAGNRCTVVFYVEYVPQDGRDDLAPGDTERAYLSRRLEEIKASHPVIPVAFPGDEEMLGGCLAAGRGFFHINFNGNAEPCPFSPYSDTNLKSVSLLEALRSPLFKRLKSAAVLQEQHNGGCVLFEHRELVEQLLTDTGT